MRRSALWLLAQGVVLRHGVEVDAPARGVGPAPLDGDAPPLFQEGQGRRYLREGQALGVGDLFEREPLPRRFFCGVGHGLEGRQLTSVLVGLAPGGHDRADQGAVPGDAEGLAPCGRAGEGVEAGVYGCAVSRFALPLLPPALRARAGDAGEVVGAGGAQLVKPHPPHVEYCWCGEGEAEEEEHPQRHSHHA